MSAKRSRILCWNVNGLRACAKKGFRRWLNRCGAEIVGIQEVLKTTSGRAEIESFLPMNPLVVSGCDKQG